MGKIIIICALVALAAAFVLASDLIDVPKSGAYSLTDVEIEKARTYAKDLGWNADQEELFIKMLSKDFGVRFENIGNNHFNITFFSAAKGTSNMEIEDGKELASSNVVGIPVTNKLTLSQKMLTIRQTCPGGKVADLQWTFKPEQMIITHVTNGHKAEIKLRKNDAFQG